MHLRSTAFTVMIRIARVAPPSQGVCVLLSPGPKVLARSLFAKRRNKLTWMCYCHHRMAHSKGDGGCMP